MVGVVGFVGEAFVVHHEALVALTVGGPLLEDAREDPPTRLRGDVVDGLVPQLDGEGVGGRRAVGDPPGFVGEVVGPHDAGVQRGEVEAGDGSEVGAAIGLEDGGALVAGGGHLVPRGRAQEEGLLGGGEVDDGAEGLDLLPPRDEVADGDPRLAGGLHVGR